MGLYVVLILVLVNPGGSSGLTSQQVGGYPTMTGCQTVADEVRKRERSVAAAFCVAR